MVDSKRAPKNSPPPNEHSKGTLNGHAIAALVEIEVRIFRDIVGHHHVRTQRISAVSVNEVRAGEALVGDNLSQARLSKSRGIMCGWRTFNAPVNEAPQVVTRSGG